MLELPGPLVDAAWLAAHRDEVVVVDTRWYPDGRSARAAYEEGHVPGAAFLDLDDDLAAPPSVDGGRHPLPDPDAFAAALGRAGIGGTSTGADVGAGPPIVTYDDAGGSIAARLWWMLRVTGRPAAVLDGGLAAWPGPLATGADGPEPTEPGPAVPWPTGAVATIDEVDALRRRADHVVLDARAAARYEGAPNPLDPRPGHLPGARSAPWADNIEVATGRFRSPAELRARFGALGADGTRTVVASCGSGVTACHDLLALAVAGLPDGRLFVGSWSAWAADPARPVATGPAPGGTATDAL